MSAETGERAALPDGPVTEWARCGKCGHQLPHSAFYRRSATDPRPRSSCKSCYQRTAKLGRDWDSERDANRDRMRRNRMLGRTTETYRPRPSDVKRRARCAVGRALLSGRIVRPDMCSECNRKRRLTAHHHDYRRPLEVTWLCYECHGLRHRGPNKWEAMLVYPRGDHDQD